MSEFSDVTFMRRAMQLADLVRRRTSPNPWVGVVLVANGEIIGEGSTSPPGGPHAEVTAISLAGDRVKGATCYTTLEPCHHTGRTGPCDEALIAAGISRVVIGIEDPDDRVSGSGIAHLRAHGIEVEVGVLAAQIDEQLAPYITHRKTGRPYVVLKYASSLDGRIAAPDGSSAYVTGAEARADVQELRADSDAILVGANTVRRDDPALTVRLAPTDSVQPHRDPLRVVLGKAPIVARIHPCVELSGDLGKVLDNLGSRGILQVLVEGGAKVAHDFRAQHLIDRYVVYMAPAFFGGDDAVPVFSGPGVTTIDEVERPELLSVRHIGGDLRFDLLPRKSPR